MLWFAATQTTMEATTALSASTPTPPQQWPWALASPPLFSSDRSRWTGALLRGWSGTSPVMVQPPLDHHYVVMHLGGDKRVTRRRDGPGVSHLAADGSITLVPAGSAYVWRTDGPIAFAHLYLHPERFADVGRDIGHHRDRAGGTASLVDTVGALDRELTLCFARMIDELRSAAEPSLLLLDSMLESLTIRLAQRYADRRCGSAQRVASLAPHRLQRVLDFIDTHFARDISLADLVAAAGSSQFHFSHAFHASIGCSPYQFLMRRRIECARVLLLASEQSLDEVGSACGFHSQRQFSQTFKRFVGIGPKRHRSSRVGRRKPAAPA